MVSNRDPHCPDLFTDLIMRSFEFYIGIDPGVLTGVCIWNHPHQTIERLQSMKIHEAFELIRAMHIEHPGKIMIRVEDARMRHWFNNSGSELWQGAGSIKRDCKIWEDYLTDLHIHFEMVAPRNNLTKLTRLAFGNITGYHAQSNEHQRAAAMLVYGL